MSGRGREIALGAVLLILVIWWFRPVSPPDLTGPADAVKAEKDLPVDELRSLIDIEWALLAGGGGEYQGGGRNLFDYGVIKPPPPTPEELARLEEERRRRLEEERRRREEAERLRREALEKQREAARQRAAQQQPPPGDRKPPKPTPPAMTLKFIGLVGEANNEIAIFLDGADFLLAKEGETLKKDFLIRKISYDRLQIGFTDPRFAEEFLVLPLGG